MITVVGLNHITVVVVGPGVREEARGKTVGKHIRAKLSVRQCVFQCVFQYEILALYIIFHFQCKDDKSSVSSVSSVCVLIPGVPMYAL